MKWLDRLRALYKNTDKLTQVQQEKKDLEKKFKSLYDRTVEIAEADRKERNKLHQEIENLKKKLQIKTNPVATPGPSSSEIEKIKELEKIVAEEKRRADKFYKMYVDIQSKYVQIEELGRADLRRRVIADFRELGQTDAKLLWVNSPDPRVVNSGTYAQIKDIMQRIAPSIEMIVLTYGAVKLFELTDKELNSIGLARITHHTGGAIGVEQKKITDEREIQ